MSNRLFRFLNEGEAAVSYELSNRENLNIMDSAAPVLYMILQHNPKLTPAPKTLAESGILSVKAVSTDGK